MSNFWSGKRVFVTGHTGFKGSWLCTCLVNKGAIVFGYSLAPKCDPALYTLLDFRDKITQIFADVRDADTVKKEISNFRPDIILHLAAQPLVRYSYENPVETYSTNIMGTINIFEAARRCPSVKAIVNVTTDKCYQNNEWLWGYREYEPMGGVDPYSASKGCSELVTSSYYQSYFENLGIGLASARAGNVIGGGDWSSDRLIPDLIVGLEQNAQIKLRNPNALRPWQHVLEPVSGYLQLAEKLFGDQKKFSGAWNFGPNDEDAKSVGWIAEQVYKEWGTSVNWSKDEGHNPHEATYLKLDISKARTVLGWEPVWPADKAIAMTVEWYKKYFNGADIVEFTNQQIAEFSV